MRSDKTQKLVLLEILFVLLVDPISDWPVCNWILLDFVITALENYLQFILFHRLTFVGCVWDPGNLMDQAGKNSSLFC